MRFSLTPAQVKDNASATECQAPFVDNSRTIDSLSTYFIRSQQTYLTLSLVY